jgi:sRNA-binding protein
MNARARLPDLWKACSSVTNKVYRRLQAGATRINLNGEPAGIVTPEQAVAPAKRPAPNPKPTPRAAPETIASTRRLSLADLRVAGERRKAVVP